MRKAPLLHTNILVATKGKGHKGCYNEPLLLQLVYLIAISVVLGLGCELILGQHRLKILTIHKSALVSSLSWNLVQVKSMRSLPTMMNYLIVYIKVRHMSSHLRWLTLNVCQGEIYIWYTYDSCISIAKDFAVYQFRLTLYYASLVLQVWTW